MRYQLEDDRSAIKGRGFLISQINELNNGLWSNPSNEASLSQKNLQEGKLYIQMKLLERLTASALARQALTGDMLSLPGLQAGGSRAKS
jgi:hypothetical protein